MLEQSQKRLPETITKLHLACGKSLDELEPIPPPRCSHGEALRFSRIEKKTGECRDFYACSVSRDRKLCRLFYWVEDWHRRARRSSADGETCFTVPTREKKARYDPNLGIDTLVDNSSNAQFTFDRDSISTIVSICKQTNVAASPRKMLCIGTPSIHVELKKQGIDSVLLDVDDRLSSIADSVYRYNMFTGEFLETAPDLADDFSAIVCDPPFHPELFPALFNSLKRTFPNSYDSSLILFACPYFFSEQVTSACPRLGNMTDIRLTYFNHKKYVSGNRSPVRLFTSSASLKSILPTVPRGYHICTHCDEIVSDHNKHCTRCNRCTSIAGKTPFKHCDACQKCVKATAVHCDSCNRCFISSHTCSQ